MVFASKCSAKITASINANVRQLVEYVLINSGNWIHDGALNFVQFFSGPLCSF